MLIEKKSDLEKTIAELEKERAALQQSLKAQNITGEQEQTLYDFTQKIGEDIELADTNFQTRRGVIEALGVEATLAFEDEQKIMTLMCILGENYYVLSLALGNRLAPVQLCGPSPGWYIAIRWRDGAG
jgi:hypothetical protein